MTDLEKLKKLLDEFGVEYSEDKKTTEQHYKHDFIAITCVAGKKKVEGYSGFITIFEFTLDGKFIQMGAWE